MSHIMIDGVVIAQIDPRDAGKIISILGRPSIRDAGAHSVSIRSERPVRRPGILFGPTEPTQGIAEHTISMTISAIEDL